MGCGCSIPVQTTDTSLLNEPLDCNLIQIASSSSEYIQLNMFIERASSILKTFESYREKIVDKFDLIVYKTGACIFTNPSIDHCINNLWYKISLEYNCNIAKADIKYIDDPPFINMLITPQISEDTRKLIDIMNEYITYLRSIKTSLKQLEGALAELIYLVNEVEFPENNPQLFVNKSKINKGVRMFPELLQFYRQLLQKFRYEVYLFDRRKEIFIEKIDKVAKLAKDKGCKTIYQIVEMYRIAMKENPEICREEAMMKNEEAGRKKYLEIINKKNKKKKKLQYTTFELEDKIEEDI